VGQVTGIKSLTAILYCDRDFSGFVDLRANDVSGAARKNENSKADEHPVERQVALMGVGYRMTRSASK
jgi:hypothetical protein